DDAAAQLQKLGVAENLQQRGQMLVTAESCTGGWIAKTLTDIAASSCPGASPDGATYNRAGDAEPGRSRRPSYGKTAQRRSAPESSR
ncbi:MAG TPA: CinA family protein, partial [Tahibacter sp.]|nr:CinA family protein [Tahibacter sp.]